MELETEQTMRDVQTPDWAERTAELSEYFSKASSEKTYYDMCDYIDSESTRYE